MGNSVATTNWKLVSQYDNAGVRLAMKDMSDSKKMIAGMSMVSPSIKKDNPMMAMLGESNKEMMCQFDTQDKLQKARMLGDDLRAKAQAQRASREIADAQTLAAIEQTRHNRAIDFLLNEDKLAKNKTIGGGIGSKGAMALQQVGFGLQDFSSQYATRGLAGGIGAVSNNVQMLGAALGPTGLAVTAIGGAVAGIILPSVVKWLDGSEKIEEHTKNIKSNYDDLKATIQGVRDAASFGPGLSRGDDAQKQIDKLTEERSTLARAQSTIMKDIKQEQAGNNDRARVGALQQSLTELTVEYEKTDARLKAITREWSPARLAAAAAKADREKMREENQKFIDESYQKANEAETKRREAGFALIKGMGASNIEKYGTEAEKLSLKQQKELEDFDTKTKGITGAGDARNQLLAGQAFEREKVANEQKLRELTDVRAELADGKQTANGSSSASIRGTSAAFSAINRAIAGTRSSESEQTRVIMKMDEQIKVMKELLQKARFARQASIT